MRIEKIVKLLLEELVSKSTPSVENVNNAIDNHEKVIISYDGEGKDKFKGPRMVDIYAYGLTKSGNPVIRGFQQYPHHSKTIKGWKLFRLDRITAWKNTGQKFYKPESFGGYGEFNKNGDKTMSVVYNIAKFDDNTDNPSLSVRPKTKTATEIGLSRLKNAVENPIYLKDIKKEDGFSGVKDTTNTSGPKTLDKKSYSGASANKHYDIDDIYKQLNGEEPVDRLSDEYFGDYEKAKDRSQKERDMRALGITGDITPEKLKNSQGSVDKMKKYHKDSANDVINQISKEELNKVLERLRKEQNNS